MDNLMNGLYSFVQSWNSPVLAFGAVAIAGHFIWMIFSPSHKQNILGNIKVICIALAIFTAVVQIVKTAATSYFGF